MRNRRFLVLVLVMLSVVLLVCENAGVNAESFNISDEELAMAYVEDNYGEGNYRIVICQSDDDRVIFGVYDMVIDDYIECEFVSRDVLVDAYWF